MFAAFREAINMAQFAHERTVGLRDGTLINLADKWTTFRTFRVFWTRMGLNAVPPMAGVVDPDAITIGNRIIGKSSVRELPCN